MLMNEVYEPELQYMNVYQGKSKRLTCFQNISDQPFFTPNNYQVCDASKYENHLNQIQQ